MAWRYKVAKKTPDPDNGTVGLDVDYYDDAAPATVIARRAFSFPAYMTTALIQAEIKHEGLKEKTRRAAVDALAAAVPDNYDAPV